MNQYRVARKLTHPELATRRAVAAALISALVGLALFTVTHIHGITDPNEAHNATDLSLQAQMGTGVALVSAGSVLPAPMVLGSSPSERLLPILLTLHRVPVTRGPPSFPQ